MGEMGSMGKYNLEGKSHNGEENLYFLLKFDKKQYPTYS